MSNSTMKTNESKQTSSADSYSERQKKKQKRLRTISIVIAAGALIGIIAGVISPILGM